MQLWFVSAAWRRFPVTRLALAQRERLCAELAGRGIDATGVIVADDENLEIAAEYGFHTVEQSNTYLGRKFNDGLEYACRQGAEYVVLIGSDDWMHASMFDRLPLPQSAPPDLTGQFVVWKLAAEVITGRDITLVDLQRGRLRRCRSKGHYGVIPWILHRRTLDPSRGRPVKDRLQIGVDGSLIAGLGMRPEWVFVDPHEFCRVDFKSDTNLNSYEKITRSVGVGEEETDPWPLLREHYDADLVEMAERTCERVAA